MADGEKKGLFGKLFRRKGEEQETTPSELEEVKKEKASPEPTRPETVEDLDREAPPGPFDDLPPLDPPSVSGTKTDIVELEMDIPEDEISTVALSLDDLEAARALSASRGDTSADEEPDDGSFPDIQLETAEIEDITEIKLDKAEIPSAVNLEAPAAEIPSDSDTTEELETIGPAQVPVSLEDVEAELSAEDRGMGAVSESEIDVDEDREPALPQTGEVTADREEADQVVPDETPVTARDPSPEGPQVLDGDREIIIEDDEDPDFDITPDEKQPASTPSEPAVGTASPEFVVPQQAPLEPVEAPVEAPEHGDESPPPEEVSEVGATPDVGGGETEDTLQQTSDPAGEEDLFSNYVAALSRFVMNRETPLSVSIQGDSGSGKTVLMHRIADDLDDSQYVKTWFPSRDYSRFNDRNEVPALLIRRVLYSVERSVPHDKVWIVRQMIDDALPLMNRLWKTGFLAETRGTATIEIDDSAEAHAANGESDTIAGLKLKLREIVHQGLESADKKRIVVFVDDMDRIDPSLGLDLLETIVTFLMIERSVFVVACGPAGIERGIRATPSSVSTADTPQSYFDRVFQLTVSLPSSADRLEEFVSDLLRSTGFDYSERTLDSVLPLFRYSVGVNPRRIKRIEDRLVFAAAMNPEFCFASDGEPLPRYRNQKLLLALGCLDTEFGPVFRLLLSKRNDDGELTNLIDERLRDDGRIGDLDKEYGLLGGALNTGRLNRLIAFMDLFSDLVHAGDPYGKLGREDISLLKRAIDLIALTSTMAPEPSYEESERSALTEFCTRVKRRLNKLLPDLAPDGSVESIRNWPSPRPWFGLWYTDTAAKKVWGQGRVYYEVSFDAANRNTVSVGLKCNTARLDDFGVDRGAVDRLKNLPIVSQDRYRVDEHDSGWLEIVKVLADCTCGDVDEVNDAEVETIAKELKELVRATHDIFDARTRAKVLRPDKRQAVKRPLPSCKVCGSELQPVTTKDGDTGFKCEKCRKIYKPKSSKASEQPITATKGNEPPEDPKTPS